MRRKVRKGLLMASGGLDSTVLMYELADKDVLEEVASVAYGQASSPDQAQIIQFHADNLGIPWKIHHIPVPDAAFHSNAIRKYGFVPKRGGVLAHQIKNDKERHRFITDDYDWVNGRNSLWMLHLAIYAVSEGYDTIYTAFQFDTDVWKKDVANGDTSPDFVAAMNDVLYHSFLEDIEIVAPYLRTKSPKLSIAKRGIRFGVELARTYSCEFYPPCRECYQCTIRTEVFKKLGVDDHIYPHWRKE